MAAETPLTMQFKKMYSQPINPDSVFDSLELAQAYASGPTGAAGEMIGVKRSDSDKYDAYIINKDKSISSVVPEEMTNSIDEIIKALTWTTL